MLFSLLHSVTIRCQMLFSAKDFQDRSKRLWQRYLDDKADRPVNLPSAVHKALRKEIVEKDCAVAVAAREPVSLNSATKLE